MLNFTDKQILVVGGSSGMGLATAQLAAELGAQVTIAARSPEKLARALDSIHGPAQSRTLDLTSDDAVTEFFADGTTWDHVVVTASEVSMAAVRELAMPTAYAAMDSKFWGFYRVARHAQVRPGGSLGVVAGFLATRPTAGRALMGAINGALESLVQGLALELRPVRVNAVSPAVVVTPMWNGLSAPARESLFNDLAAKYPAGCVGDAADIARQLLLLAHTPYATGTIVTLDGGASLA